MAQVVAGQLVTAMESLERQPAIGMASSGIIDPIPMIGMPFSGGGTESYNPATLALGDGRFAVVYFNGSDTTLGISNAEGSEFTLYNIGGFYWGQDGSMVELADGSIGIVYTSPAGHGNAIGYVVVDPNTGDYISYGTIRSGAPEEAATVARRLDGTYIAMWVDFSGGTYSINYKTSADFATWSGQSTASLSGIDMSLGIGGIALVQDPNGELSLFFSHADAYGPNGEWLENIYHFVSTDGGINFSPASGTPGDNPGEVTGYYTFSPTGWGPDVGMSSSGYYRAVYTEHHASLYMDHESDGWYEHTPEYGGVEYITLDIVNRRMIVVCMNSNLTFQGLQIVNLDSWEIEKSIFPSSSPNFSDMWYNQNPQYGVVGWYAAHSEGGKVVLLFTGENNAYHAAIYDSVADTIKEIHFADWAMYGITINATPRPQAVIGILGVQNLHLTGAWLDDATNRLYMLWVYNYVSARAVEVGYVDVSGSGPFTYTVIFEENTSEGTAKSQVQVSALSTSRLPLQVFPDEGLMIITAGWHQNLSNYAGYTRIYSMAGALWKDLDVYTNGMYPLRGLRTCILVNGILYGGFLYEPNYGEESKRGLLLMDIYTDTIAFSPPTHYTRDDYQIYYDMDYDPDSNILIMASGSDGILTYNIGTGEWGVYNQYVYAGMMPGGSPALNTVAYDPTTLMLYAGANFGIYGNMFLIAINILGDIQVPMYVDVQSNGGGNFTYGDPSRLVLGWENWTPTVVYPIGGASGYYFWAGLDPQGVESVFQGQDELSFRLDRLLPGGSAVTIKRSIDGKPNSLSFSLTHGHLFDPHNVASLWAGKVDKGRVISISIGEIIGGIESLHPIGEFIVLDNKVSYQRGTYPIMTVTCEDKRTFWEDEEIVATEDYEATPNFIIEDILTTFDGMDSSEIDIPTLTGEYEIHFQWLDTTVMKVVNEILNRFGYYCVITPDGIVTARPISIYNVVDHTYEDATKIIGFTPDDSFSDYTNRVIVAGESRDFIEVVYAEEAIEYLTGTTGWWGGDEERTVWFSADHKRRCRNPRIEVIMDGSSQLMGGASAYISYLDPNELYCIVHIDYPNLIAEVVSTIIALIALGIACGSTKVVAGFCFIMWVFLLAALFYLVVQIGQYQYQVHAQPYGEERLGIQGQADDFDFQTKIDRVVEKKFDEPLCVTVQQCIDLAQHELMVAAAQRRRVQFDKIADLRDEEGDTILIPHPHSGAALSVFITDLTRNFKVPSGPDDSSAGVFDNIEGWAL